jgi:signal peptidase II
MVFAGRNISRVYYAVIALVVFAGDQVTKRIIESSIPERGTVTVIPGLFSLTNVKNVGAAFGLFADSPAAWKTGLLILASAGLLGAVASIVWRNPKLSWKAGVGLSLIMGGAFSNLIDRIRAGRVVDFLDFYLRSYHWYTFNLADSAIVIGAGLLIIQVISSD